MALAETANLIVNLGLKGNFTRDIGKANRALDSLTKGESRAYKAGAQIGTGIKNAAKLAAVGIGIVAVQVEQGLESLVKLEAQTEATNAAIGATKGVAGITATAVRKMAEEFEAVNALFGDEVIQSAENMLLAFTNIRGKTFKPTLQAVLDLNAGMGQGPEGLVTTAKTLGIALNDPTKGLGRLSRAGVQFTAAQTKRIKQLQKEGKLYEAQAIILKEVEKRFGGRFSAFGGETARKVAKFHDAIEDLQRTLAAGLLPVVSNIADALTELFADPAIQKGVSDFGQDLAKVLSPANIKSAISDIKDFAKTIGPAFGAAASAIGTVVDAFGKLPPDLRNLLVGAFAVNKLTGGLVTNVAGGLAGAVAGALKKIVTPVVNVEGAVVNVNGGVGGAAGAAAGSAGWLGSVKAVAGVIAPAIAVALAQSAITGETNKNMGTNFIAPGVGGIGGGIITAIHNLTEVVKLAQRPVVNDRAHEGSGQRRTETGKAVDKATTAIEKLKGAAVPALGKISAQAKTDAAIIAANQARTAGETKQAITTAGTTTSRATDRVAPPIVSAIRSNRPIISVNVAISATTVSKTVTVRERYGPSGGSVERNTRDGPQPI